MKKTLIILIVILSSRLYSQEIKGDNKESKIIILQINPYSVDKDTEVKRQITLKSNLKVEYTCIPSGVIVFSTTNRDEDLGIISKIFTEVDSNLKYKVLQDISSKEVEKNCESYRHN